MVLGCETKGRKGANPLFDTILNTLDLTLCENLRYEEFRNKVQKWLKLLRHALIM